MTTVRCYECESVVEIPDEHDYSSGPSVGCEDCGDHPAEVCPACGELIDLVYAKEVHPQ